MTVAPQLVGPSSSSGGPDPSLDVDELLADIGDRIRAERKARGWSEGGLADRAGVHRHTVRRIQQGIGSLHVLLQVCAGLGLDVAYLLSPEWVMPRLDPRPYLSPTQVDVLREAASGAPLADVAGALCMTRSAVSSHLTRIYQQLHVADLPRDQRRAAAVRTAMQHGLFSSPNRTS